MNSTTTPEAALTLSNVVTIKSTPESQPLCFHAVVLVHKVTSKTARNNSEFFAVEVGDQTGTFNFNCFSNSSYFEKIRKSNPGTIARITGITEYYQGKLSPRINDFVILTQKEITQNNWQQKLVESSFENPDALWNELQSHIASIQHPDLRTTVELALSDVGETFANSCAAISMHHAYRHGLLEHTVHMCRVAHAILPFYPEVEPNLVMAGVILHDIGKTVEYTGNLTFQKTRAGLLQGHVVIGYRIARKAALSAKLDADLTERLEHIILSHQGELEWGAAVMAATPEAVFVSMVDNLDAKMGMVQQALRRTPSTEQTSNFLPGLKTSLLVEAPKITVSSDH